MTEREILQIVARWQRRMGLERWVIEVDFENPTVEEEDEQPYPYASISYPSNYESAKIRLTPNWRTWSDDVAEQTLVHELVHIWTRDMQEAFSIVSCQLTSSAYSILYAAFDQRHEATVELIARRLIALAGEER